MHFFKEISSRKLALATLAFSLSSTTLLTGCGPGYLTPEQVREHIAAPGGEVTENKIGFAVDDIFKAKRASTAEDSAFFLKGSALGIMPMATAASYANPVADVFCAAGLVASVASFDECSEGSDCEAEFVVDSCLFRIGENGDEKAAGRIKFYLKSVETATAFEDEMRITFEGFSSSLTSSDEVAGGLIETLDGIIAVATVEQKARDETEVVFSADVDYRIQKAESGLFEDPVVERSRATAALRFTQIEEEGFSSGTLDLVAFVDDSDDTRDESVVISFAAESRDIGNLNLSNATLSVRGSNGNFECTFSSAEETLGADSATYQSQGQCIDVDSGDEWSFNSTAETQS